MSSIIETPQPCPARQPVQAESPTVIDTINLVRRPAETVELSRRGYKQLELALGYHCGLSFDGTTITLFENYLENSPRAGSGNYRLRVDGEVLPVESQSFQKDLCGRFALRYKLNFSSATAAGSSSIEVLKKNGSQEYQEILFVRLNRDSFNNSVFRGKSAAGFDPSSVLEEMERASSVPPAVDKAGLLKSLSGEVPWLRDALPDSASADWPREVIGRAIAALVDAGLAYRHMRGIAGLLVSNIFTAEGLTVCLERFAAARQRASVSMIDLMDPSDKGNGFSRVSLNLASEVHLLAGVVSRMAKRFLPASLDQIEAGDVLQFEDGSRLLIAENSSNHDRSFMLRPEGQVAEIREGLFDLCRDKELVYVERGHGIGLFPGIEQVQAEAYADWRYFASGDRIYLDYGFLDINAISYSAGGAVSFLETPGGAMAGMRTCQSRIENSELLRESKKLWFSKRLPSAALSADEILDLHSQFLLASARKNSAGTRLTFGVKAVQLNPQVKVIRAGLNKLQLLAANYVQHMLDRTLGLKNDSIRVQLANARLQVLSAACLSSQIAVSAVSDFLQIGPPVAAQDAKEPLLDLHCFSDDHLLKSASYLKDYMLESFKQLCLAVKAGRGIDLEHHSELNREYVQVIDDFAIIYQMICGLPAYLSKLLPNSHGTAGSPQLEWWTQFEDLSVCCPDLMRQLNELGAAQRWSCYPGTASSAGTTFSYDPLSDLERLSRLPFAQLITYRVSQPDNPAGRVQAALLAFEFGKEPPELVMEGASLFPAALVKLVQVHPDWQRQGIAKVLDRALSVHLQRTPARGFWGAIAMGHRNSLAAQLGAGGRLGHDWLRVKSYPDGSQVVLRPLFVISDPQLLAGTPDFSDMERQVRLRLLENEDPLTGR